ncbi:MAG: hydantoinase/oxoprolinase family protein [Deltaproteobacteria bacterium]|nr:hydantoinase/oxoprolinase family protein [Deltaproteobacteria bacterium]
MALTYTADIDTGSTFTDGYFTDGQRYWLAKVETTPHDFTVGFLACLAEGAKQIGLADVGALLRQCEVIRFCTTLTTNALVQGQGTRLGLLASRGLGAEIADGLVEPQLIAEIDEEVDAAGVVVSKPRPGQVVEAARGLLGRGARALVVALRGSARAPESEREVERILDAEYPPHLLGCVPVTLSHQVSRRPEDKLRATAALLDARVRALLARSLREAEDGLRERGFPRPLLIVHADGGCGRVAKTRALDTYASGPAAVVHGAAKLCGGRRETSIAMDIGGTTTDLAFVTGPVPRVLPLGEIGGRPIGQPLLETWSLGLGGGSLARMTPSKLTVGPESAGVLPGPACFDLGATDVTVTDACLVLGYFAADRFCGGRRRLSVGLALRALRQLAPASEPSHLAAEIKDALEAKVAAAIRARAGNLDLQGARILALGGGGGLHAAAIAAKLGLREVDLYPWSPAFGAFGASMLDVVHVYQACLEGQGAVDGRLPLGAWFRDLVAAARRDAEDEGFAAAGLTYEIVLEHAPTEAGATAAISRQVVSVDQEFVTLPDGASARMAWLRARFALARRAEPATLVPSAAAAQSLGTRQVLWAAGQDEQTTAVHGLEALAPDARLPGPCLVESQFATLAVPPGWTFLLEPNGWMHLQA